MLSKLTSSVEEAGKIFKEFYYNKVINIKHKGDIDLVTEYDLKMEQILIEKLSSAFPGFTLIGEETSESSTAITNGKVIYIDPIDGTTNFVHKFPFTAISVGAYIDNEPYLGAVYNPILDELYYAKAGKGAFLNGRQIFVSKEKKLINSLFATGFSYDKNTRDKFMPYFKKLLDKTQGTRRAGSAALDLCYTAKGTFEFYMEMDLKPWDMAAGIIILKEAGGTITGVDSKPHGLGKDLLIASNGEVHKEVLNELNSVE